LVAASCADEFVSDKMYILRKLMEIY